MERYEFLDCNFPKLTTMVENRPVPKHITVKCQNTVLQTEHMCSHVHTHIIFKDQKSERRMASYSSKVMLKKYKTVEWCLISNLEFYQPNEPKYLSKYEHWIYTIAGIHNLKKKKLPHGTLSHKVAGECNSEKCKTHNTRNKSGQRESLVWLWRVIKIVHREIQGRSPECSTSEGYGHTSRNKSYWMIHWIDLVNWERVWVE